MRKIRLKSFVVFNKNFFLINLLIRQITSYIYIHIYIPQFPGNCGTIDVLILV